jgi:VIT1/CCC1 family predicted Fe2+/Mn2+ transporter
MSDSEAEKLFEERKKVARLSQIRELVFGAEDGLLVPLGVVSGVAAATTNNFYVLIAGLAEAFAGSISMGAGAYLSSKAEHEVQQWAISRERSESRRSRKSRRRKLRYFSRARGSHLPTRLG